MSVCFDRLDKELKDKIEGLSEEEAKKIIADEQKSLKEKLKRIGVKVIPPKKLLFVFVTRKFLYPEEISVSLDKEDGFEFITLWFRFPYDKYQGDGPEYEPITLVLKGDEIIEVQTRVHWRIVHIAGNVLFREEGASLFTTFSAHGHTPIPVIKAEYADEKYFGYIGEEGKVVLIEKFGTFWDGVSARWLKSKLIKLAREFRSWRSSLVIKDLFEFPVILRAYPAKIKRNPMSKPWFSKPIFL